MSIEEVRPAKGAADLSMHVIADPQGHPRLMQWMAEKDYGSGLWFDMRSGGGGSPDQFWKSGFRYLAPFDPVEVVMMHEAKKATPEPERCGDEDPLRREAAREMRDSCKSIAIAHKAKITVNEELWHQGQDWAAQRIAEAIEALPLPGDEKGAANAAA